MGGSWGKSDIREDNDCCTIPRRLLLVGTSGKY